MKVDDFFRREYGTVAGVDEAGRGCIAGPVVAAAVVLFEDLEGVVDSKLLSPEKREELYRKIREKGIIGVGIASAEEVDIYNVFNATRLAMERAIGNLGLKPSFVIIDGKGLSLSVPSTCMVKGDRKSTLIGAASIVAKVLRDEIMREFSKVYPLFSFDKHKGYATKEHLEEIKKNGVLPIHRLSFQPILSWLTVNVLEDMVKGDAISKERFTRILNLMKGSSLGGRKRVDLGKEGTGGVFPLFETRRES